MKQILDLHVHTISSGHAYSTVKENIDEAKNKGLKILGISDHAPSMPGASHLFHFQNMKVIKDNIDGVRVLKGIEANIIDYHGRLDVDEKLLSSLDYAIASLHPPCIKSGTIEENTDAVIGAMKNPYVKIIGHPDDSRIPIDYEKLVLAAKKTGTLLEINNSSLKPNAFREGARENVFKMLSLCKKHNVMVVMGSDSHIYYEVGGFENCINVLKEANFPDDLVLNYREDALKILHIK